MSGFSDRIARLRRLVDPAVLLPWPCGSKGDRRKWKHLQLADMNETSHLAKLESAGNIGVALGRISNGLVTIDLDNDNYVTAFLAANPLLGDTLRTRGRRGCNVWLRCSADYPPSQQLKDSSNELIGEWPIRWKSNHYRRDSPRGYAISLRSRKACDRHYVQGDKLA